MPVYKLTVEQEIKMEGIELLVNPAIEESIFPGFSYFDIKVKNNTGKILKILWDQSSLFYNSTSHVPFISGQKYSDATKPAPSSIIPNTGDLSVEVFSSSEVFYKSDWYILPIYEENITLLLCIQVDNKCNYYTIAAQLVKNDGISKMYLQNREKGSEFMKDFYSNMKTILKK
jgi:hypothetical protein